MINVSMASWLQDVQGFMSRVIRRNRLMAIAADDRKKMIEDTIFCLLRKIFNLRAGVNTFLSDIISVHSRVLGTCIAPNLELGFYQFACRTLNFI